MRIQSGVKLCPWTRRGELLPAQTLLDELGFRVTPAEDSLIRQITTTQLFSKYDGRGTPDVFACLRASSCACDSVRLLSKCARGLLIRRNASGTITYMELRIHATRREMGEASARAAVDAMLTTIEREGRVVIVLASAVSQDTFLEALASDPRMDWSRVTAFHLDEYIGIGADHPASFRRFQHDRMWSRVRPAAFHELNGDARDVHEETARYSELLEQEKPSIGFLGIGENGHLAFNDPPVDFDDPQLVRVVQLDEVCRMQQVRDGAFPQILDVPRTALTLTIPAIMRIPKLILNVPGSAKAEAVRRTVEGPVTPDCPASILRRHPDATLYIDADAARLLNRNQG